MVKNTNLVYLLFMIFIICLCSNNICNQNISNVKVDQEEQICQNEGLSIVILLHLYDLNLMDEFIAKINRFIKNNRKNRYYIKVNIPVDKNVTLFKRFEKSEIIYLEQKDSIHNQCILLAPYHSEKITKDNCIKLHLIANYLKESFVLDNKDIQVMYSENRGVDIGGFFLLIDQVIKQNIKHDYIIKLHSKSKPDWRKELLSILDLKINDVLPKYQSVYACRHIFPKPLCKYFKDVCFLVNEILYILDMPKNYKRAPYSAGTMFIVSSKVTNFFKKYSMLNLFKRLNLGFPKSITRSNPLLEHGFEAFFGYLIEVLNLRTLVLSYYKNKSLFLPNEKIKDFLIR